MYFFCLFEGIKAKKNAPFRKLRPLINHIAAVALHRDGGNRNTERRTNACSSTKECCIISSLFPPFFPWKRKNTDNSCLVVDCCAFRSVLGFLLCRLHFFRNLFFFFFSSINYSSDDEKRRGPKSALTIGPAVRPART